MMTLVMMYEEIYRMFEDEQWYGEDGRLLVDVLAMELDISTRSVLRFYVTWLNKPKNSKERRKHGLWAIDQFKFQIAIGKKDWQKDNS